MDSTTVIIGFLLGIVAVISGVAISYSQKKKFLNEMNVRITNAENEILENIRDIGVGNLQETQVGRELYSLLSEKEIMFLAKDSLILATSKNNPVLLNKNNNAISKTTTISQLIVRQLNVSRSGIYLFYMYEWFNIAPVIVKARLRQLGIHGIYQIPFISDTAKAEMKQWLNQYFSLPAQEQSPSTINDSLPSQIDKVKVRVRNQAYIAKNEAYIKAVKRLIAMKLEVEIFEDAMEELRDRYYGKDSIPDETASIIENLTHKIYIEQ